MVMLAARWHGPRDVRVEELPDPGPPGPGRLLLRVIRCGLCGSDRREYDAGPVLIPRRPHPLTGMTAPITLGHEILGSVLAAGDGRDADLVGARVVVDPTIACGRCAACRRGDRRLCASAACLGVSADGGLATFVTVETGSVVRVPCSLPDDHAALAEPLAVALHAVDRADLRLGERVVVTGFGPIGAGVVLASLAAGAPEVVVVEPDPGRRARAAELGAHTVDPGDQAALRGIAGAADAGFECSGAPSAVMTALRAVRAGGRVVVPAVSREPVAVDLRRLVLAERALIGTVGYQGDVGRAVALMSAGLIDPSALAGPTIPLAEVGRWFEDRSVSTALKVLVAPG